VLQQVSNHKPKQKSDFIAALKAIDEEEARAARLFASGKITDHIWDSLWREWQNRRQALRASLDALKHKSEYHISHLDDALNIISQIGVLYKSMELRDQKRLLREVVNKIVVNKQGNVLRMELLPPFGYLRLLSERVGGNGYTPENTKTSTIAGSCSSEVSFKWAAQDSNL
jgi:hypothetical protein